MAVLDEVIDETGKAFGLGGKARPLVVELLRTAVDPRNGGTAAFVERFRAAGMDDVVDGWLGKAPPVRPTMSQIRRGVGAATITHLAARCNLAPDTVAAAITDVVPRIMPTLLPGGDIPGDIPAEVRALVYPMRGTTVAAVTPALAVGAAKTAPRRLWWLPVGVVAAMLVGWWALSQRPTPPPSAPPSTGAPATPR